MSDDEKDVFEEAMEHNDDLFGVTSEIRLDEPEITLSSSPPRTSVTEIVTDSKSFESRQNPKTGKYIEISISYPEKVGSGMGSYFIYKVTTKTNRPSFLHQEIMVRRRFSDFLGLHERLKMKYLCAGCIIPPAPEKDAFGNTKLKLSKEDQTNSEFLERRRAALERYLQRIARHPLLVIDADFREFLEEDKDLPKAVSTLSGANMKKFIKNVGDAVGKITTKMEDCDQWFDDKQVEMDNLDRHLNQIHSSFEHLINQRKELAVQIKVFAQHCSQLSHVEEHNGLARALAQLSSTKEEISTIEERQADIEFFTLLELLKDYLGLIGAIKDVLNERVRQYRVWQEAEANLNRKREQKARCELSGKSDKVPALEMEIKECLNKVDRSKDDFDKVSKTIKKEIEVFDLTKVSDFKESIIKVLEAMITSQEQIIRHWEKYVPDTAGIST